MKRAKTICLEHSTAGSHWLRHGAVFSRQVLYFCGGLFSDLQAVEEVGGRRKREVQLSLLALLEESVQVGVLAQREENIII